MTEQMATTWARPELAYWPLIAVCWVSLLCLAWVRLAGWGVAKRVVGLIIVGVAAALPIRLLTLELASRSLTVAVLACAVVGLGAVLARRRPMDRATLLGLILAVLVIGVWYRAERLSLVFEQHPPLNPDAVEAYESGPQMLVPWQPAFRCGLWYIPVGIVARLAGPDPYNVCWVSLAASIAAMLVLYWVTARWLHPFVGLVVMAGYALNPVAQETAVSGLRADAYVAMLYLVMYLLFVRQQTTWGRFIALGVVGGLLLLLRQVAAVPMLAGLTYQLIAQRSQWPRWLSALGIWLLLILPFYVSQRVFSDDGDAWRIEHRNVQFFAQHGPPAEASDSLRRELLQRLERGERIGPGEFFFRYHTAGRIVRAIGEGFELIVLGRRFSQYVPTWWVWVVVAGVAGMLWSRHRWFVVYGVFSIFPIQVFLLGEYALTERLVLHVYPFWLTIGVWALLRGLTLAVSSRHLPAADVSSLEEKL